MTLKNVINEKLEEWLLVWSLIFLVLIVMAQVISRYVINFPISWVGELSRYIFIWIAWISVSYAFQKGSHIRVEILRDKLKEKNKKILDLIVLFICFTLALFLAVYGTIFISSVNSTGQTSPSLSIPMWIVYLAIPIAGILICIRLIQQVKMIFQNDRQSSFHK